MYQRLETALSNLIGGQKPIKGTLGYTIEGAYRVTVAEDTAKYYVRFGDGSFAQVYHRGRVSPVPDLPVEVGFDSAGNMVIVGGDPDRGGLFDGAHEVGPHSHARGSGLEFLIDTRLLTPVKAEPLSGLTVEVAQGAYRSGEALRWWSGGSITLTPPASANTWAWIAIGLDAATETLVTASGSAIVVSAPLEPSTIPAISLAGAIPLAAVRVRHGQTELDDADFEDLRYSLTDIPAALDDLSDVDTSDATDGDVLTYGSGLWTPQPSSGGSGGGGTIYTNAYSSAPSSPANGDWWLPSDGLGVVFARVGGAWVNRGLTFPFTQPVDGDFAWVNQGSAVLTADKGAIFLSVTNPGAEQIRIRKKSAPATPYTVTAAFTPIMMPTASGGSLSGIGWRSSSAQTTVLFRVTMASGVQRLELTKHASSTAGVAHYQTLVMGIAPTLWWLRIEDDGTNRKVYFSADGQNFCLFHSVGRTDYLTADEVLFFVGGNNSTFVGMTLYSWKEG